MAPEHGDFLRRGPEHLLTGGGGRGHPLHGHGGEVSQRRRSAGDLRVGGGEESGSGPGGRPGVRRPHRRGHRRQKRHGRCGGLAGRQQRPLSGPGQGHGGRRGPDHHLHRHFPGRDPDRAQPPGAGRHQRGGLLPDRGQRGNLRYPGHPGAEGAGALRGHLREIPL